MEDGKETAMLSGTPQGGVVSPLLSNIFLHFLDKVWTRQCAHLGAHRLRGTVRYPGKSTMPPSDRPPVSRVREIRMHGLKGGFDSQPGGLPSETR